MATQAAPERTAERADLDRRRRHRDDFLYYAPRVLYIRTKAGAIQPLQLNVAQQHIHSKLEEQLKRIGKVRALILKGRQQGCSTYVEARFYWKVSHRRGRKAFILTHEDKATNNLFGMAKRYHDLCPPPLRPSTTAANAKELKFDKLDSGYQVGTAGSKGVGRSDTLQYFHGSEVAYWPFADTHLSGVLQAVPDLPGTEVILESTASGNEGVFYEKCMSALKGEDDFILIFVPWYWQAEYRSAVPKGFKLTSEEEKYKALYSLDNQQILWRRKKVVELRGVQHFRREYPATVEEAIKAEAEGALWRRETIDATRVSKVPPLKRIVVAVDPSGGDGPQNDEVGIVAAGLSYANDAYILNDVSGRLLPAKWGLRTVALYDKLKADRIVGEKNYGGAMVAHTIRTVDGNVSYKDVNATRGKDVRAEPISALYDQGRVHHVGVFIALEDEMVTWEPDGKKPSPNRMDAMVWAVTELLLDGKGIPLAKPEGGPQHSPYPE